MTVFQSEQLGRLEYPQEALIEFPAGLPAFETETQFLLVEQPDWKPIVFLQSASTPGLCFAALPVDAIDPGYTLEMGEEDRARLEVGPGEPGWGTLCVALLAADESGGATANLMAPIVIHPASRKGAQVIQTNGRYSHRHRIGLEREAEPCS